MGSQALLLHQVLSRHHRLTILHLLSVVLVLDHADVLGHLFELVRQTLALHFSEDAALVVISKHRNMNSVSLPLSNIQVYAQ